jgi:hypothetical protein
VDAGPRRRTVIAIVTGFTLVSESIATQIAQRTPGSLASDFSVPPINSILPPNNTTSYSIRVCTALVDLGQWVRDDY